MTTDQLRQLLSEATPGPWRMRVNPAVEAEAQVVTAEPLPGTTVPTLVAIPTRFNGKPDAAAIVAVMNLAPLLLDLWDAAQMLNIAQRKGGLPGTSGHWVPLTDALAALDEVTQP